MEKYVYNSASLERLCLSFERAYEMSSEDFYAAHVGGKGLDVPRFHRHVWASAYREAHRHHPVNGDYASRAEQTLELV